MRKVSNKAAVPIQYTKTTQPTPKSRKGGLAIPGTNNLVLSGSTSPPTAYQANRGTVRQYDPQPNNNSSNNIMVVTTS